MSKQVVIHGGDGDWYEKAIFMLRHEPPKGRTNLMSEANQIVGTYMKTQPMNERKGASPRKNTKAQWIDFFFYGSLITFVSVLSLYLI